MRAAGGNLGLWNTCQIWPRSVAIFFNISPHRRLNFGYKFQFTFSRVNNCQSERQSESTNSDCVCTFIDYKRETRIIPNCVRVTWLTWFATDKSFENSWRNWRQKISEKFECRWESELRCLTDDWPVSLAFTRRSIVLYRARKQLLLQFSFSTNYRIYNKHRGFSCTYGKFKDVKCGNKIKIFIPH